MSPADQLQFERLIYSVDAFLRERGLEVVGTKWEGKQDESEGYLVVNVKRVVGPPLHPCGFCDHAEAVHQKDAAGVGACLALDCACEVYCPPLEG